MEGCLALLALAISVVLIALPIISLIGNLQLRGRMKLLERQLDELRERVVAQSVRTAPGTMRVPEPEPATPLSPEPAPATVSATIAPEPMPGPPVATIEIPPAEPLPPEPAPEVLAAIAEGAPDLLPVESEPVAAAPAAMTATLPAEPLPPEPPPEVLAAIAEGAPDFLPSEPEADAEAKPADAGMPPPPSRPPAAPPKQGTDWERFVGVKLFSWIAAVALALAAVFFLKYSVDHGWLGAPVRMMIGLAVGVGLLVLCELKVAGRYRTTANAFDGDGIAILYATLFAAHDRWQLVPQSAAFALMVAVTAIAVILSVRRDSVFIALLGLLGGFSTPALLSTGSDRPFSLFGYLLLLNAGIGWVAYRKRWPFLSLLTLVFTTIYQWVWVVRFVDGARVGVAAAVFLVFPIVAVIALWLAGRRDGDPPGKLFEKTAQMSAVLPLVFAVYGAAVGGYADRFAVLFGFLLCVDVGLALIAAWKRDAEALHLLGAATTVLVFAVWSGFSYRAFAWPSIVGWVAAFVLFYLAAPAIVRLAGRDYTGAGRHAVLAAPALLFMFTVLSEIELRAVDPRLLFSVLFALAVALAFGAARYRSGSIWLVAGFFAVTTQFSWSLGYLVPSNVGTALAVHGAFALLFLAVPVAARAAGNPLAASRAAAIVPVLQIAIMALAARGHVARQSLAMVSIVVAISIAAVTLVASQRRRYAAMFFAVLAAFFVLACFWANVELELGAGGAIVALLGLTALSLFASNLLMKGRAEAEPRDHSPYLVLVAFVFMMVIAGNVSLARPDARFIASLGAIALMVGIAAIASRRGMLALGAGILGEIAVGIWVETVREAPTVTSGVILAVALAAFAAVLFVLKAEEQGPLRALRAKLAVGAVLTAMVAETVLISSGELPGRPNVLLIILAHVALLVCMLAVAWVTEWHVIAMFAVVPATAAFFVWRGASFEPSAWGGEMLLALALYLVLALYPLVLRESARGRIEPYLASILASATFFVFARQSLEWVGFRAIGLLPLAQAGLLAFLLDRLARREPEDQPASGTRAMVAAAVLAFVTLAVPVQLDKEFVTIAWALEVAALVWLLGKLRHPGLLAWAAGLALVVFARLTLNPAVFDYHPRSEIAIFNWYLYTYLVPAIAFLVASWLAGKTGLEWPWLRRFAVACNAGAAIFLFLLLNIEIADYYSTGSSITFDFDAGLAQDLTYTLGWALYAIALLVVGIAKKLRPARVAALGLLVVAILKCFLHDLMRLGGLYRVGSLVGLAIALAFVAVLLQKFVLRKDEAEE